MKKVFLINAYSCADKLDRIRQLIQQAAGGEEYETVESTHAGHLTEAARSYHGCTLFSIGGDGTLLEVINGAAESDNEIFVVPAGTGNDFCRMLTDEKNYERILSDTGSYTAKTADCGKAGDTYFTNIASIGYDAEIVKNSLKYKNTPVLRKFSYILALIYTIFTYKCKRLRLTVDGTVYDQKVLLAAFANGQYYGNGIHIAPTAVIDDGFLDVYICDAVGKLKLITLLPKLLNGSHIKCRYMHIIKAKEIRIESDEPVLLNLDGELSETIGTTVSVIENGIKFYTKNR